MICADVVVVVFADAGTDARTINLVRVLRWLGKRCVIVSASDETPLLMDVDAHLVVPHPAKGRVAVRWALFTRAARKVLEGITATVYWAGDLYSLPAAAAAAKRDQARLVYDARELFFALGPLAGSPIRQMVVAAIERHYIHKADSVVAVAECDAHALVRRYGIAPPSIVMNLPHFRARTPSRLLREQHHIPPGATILLYQGLSGPGRGIEPAIQALAMLPECHFCIVGGGVHDERWRELARRHGVADRLHLSGKKPYGELHLWTCSADIGLCAIEPVSESYANALPNKLFEYAMAGIPSVVSNLPAMAPIVREWHLGELCESEPSAEGIALAVRKILTQPREYWTEKAASAARYWSFERQADTIRQLTQ